MPKQNNKKPPVPVIPNDSESEDE